MVFKRYASPFLLLNSVVVDGDLSGFIHDLMDIVQEEYQWEFYLHKIIGMSYDEFRKESKAEPKMTQTDIQTAIKHSMDITAEFVPKEGGEC